MATIEELRAGPRQRLLSEARDLELAAHYADLYCEANTGRLVPGCEQVRQIAGDGTPWVAEFASLELAAALGMRDAEAAALMAWAPPC